MILERWGRVLIGLSFLISILATALPPQLDLLATHSGTHLYAFWEDSDGSIPAGWTKITTYDGKFVRGDTVANALTTGGNATHTITVSSTTVGAGNTSIIGGGGNGVAADTHAHTVAATPTVGAAVNNDPAHRTLKLIRYDAGIPTFIKQGIILMFDSGGVPPGWTRLSAHDGRMIKLDGTTVGNGGSDTHTHSLDWSVTTLNASTGQDSRVLGGGQTIANHGHTHAAPATNPGTASITALPPYVQPFIAKANADTAGVPANLLGLFDGTPGAAWSIRSHSSGSGQEFYQQLFRPNSTFSGTSTGATTHNHANVTVNSGASSSNNTSINLGGNAARGDHVHLLTSSFSTGNDNVPPYVNFAIYEKITFFLQDYRWYVNPGPTTEDVTDPWASYDIAQNTAITLVPGSSDPPDLARELRLRVRIVVSGQNLSASTIAFKLQYKQGTDGNCTTDTWADVDAGGSGGIWRYTSDTTVTDGTTLTNSRLSPASDVLQQYIRSASVGSNPNAANINQTMEYDFHIQNNTASSATRYSFRVVEQAGTPLAQYSVCPTLVTKPSTDQLMRHGNTFETGTQLEQGFTWAD